MSINSRQGIKDYALRALGYPLVEVDIDEQAMDDRIDDVLEYLQENYFDGSDRFFHKHSITATDITNGYITIPDNIWGVNSIMSMGSSQAMDIATMSPEFVARDMFNKSPVGASLVYYNQVMSHLALMEQTFTIQKQFRFNRNSDKLYIDMNWGNRVTEGQFLMIDCYAVMDPDVNTKFWNNRVFKDMVVSTFKLQWAQAYKKFSNITLPGGVTIDGTEMYQEAKQELDDQKADIMNNAAPLGFFTG